MKSILSNQAELQANYNKLSHYTTIDPSMSEYVTTGEVYDYIREMQFYLNQEIDELLLSLSNNDRAIHKPWSVRHSNIRQRKFEITKEIKSEAIDVLCFCMNILLASGVRADNIESEYEGVYKKNASRQQSQTY